MNLQATLVEDDSGAIEHGLFFRIHAYPPIWEGWCNAVRIYDRHKVYTQAEWTECLWDEQSSGWCQQHNTAPDVDRLHSGKVWLPGGWLGEVVGGLNGQFIVTERVVDQLSQNGLRPRTVEIRGNDQLAGESLRSWRAHEWHAICFDGRTITRPRVVRPEQANQCPRCGSGPIVCTRCGHIEFACSNCSAELVGYPSDREVAPVRLISSYGDGEVLGLDRWDGNHYIGGRSCYVTGRVVDVLLTLGLEPFCAQSLRTYVGNRKEAEFGEIRSRLFEEYQSVDRPVPKPDRGQDRSE
jgi:hypothetical protein